MRAGDAFDGQVANGGSRGEKHDVSDFDARSGYASEQCDRSGVENGPLPVRQRIEVVTRRAVVDPRDQMQRLLVRQEVPAPRINSEIRDLKRIEKSGPQ